MPDSDPVRMNRRRITLVVGSLGSGGAERNLLRLGEGLCQRGYEVSLLTLNPEIADFYPVPVGVKRLPISTVTGKSIRWFDLRARWKHKRMLKAILLSSNPDLVISFLDTVNINVLAALGFSPVPVIVSERIDWRYHFLNWRWRLMRRCFYPLAARVVSLARAPAIVARNYWPKWRCVFIANPMPKIDAPEIQRPSWFTAYNLVAMGRLVEQKGFDLLLEAFAQYKDKYPEWHLTILGEGVLRKNLEDLCKKLDLQERVHLPGAISPPFPVLKACDLFVFSSRYEGFGMALAEAMACGLPVISFDCPSGPADIVRDGVDGVLVPLGDVDGLAAAMDRLMGDAALRQQLAARAPEVCERFNPETILDQWCELIETVIAERRGRSLSRGSSRGTLQ